MSVTEQLVHAELLSQGGHALIVGVVLVVVLPLAFAGYVTYFVFVYLYGKRARAAAFILAEDPAEVSTLPAAQLQQHLVAIRMWTSTMQLPCTRGGQDPC